MQVRVHWPKADGFETSKVRLSRRRQFAKTLFELELFKCSKCTRVFPFEFGCDVGNYQSSKLWCDSCWYKHEGRKSK